MVKRYLPHFVLITLGTIILDQVTKYYVRARQPDLTWGVLQIHGSSNPGAAFSILQEYGSVLAVISLLVALAVIFFYYKIPQNKMPQLFWGLFLGGVVGNLIDRVFMSAVTDFIDFSFWPSFNIADATITISTIVLVVYYWEK